MQPGQLGHSGFLCETFATLKLQMFYIDIWGDHKALQILQFLYISEHLLSVDDIYDTVIIMSESWCFQFSSFLFGVIRASCAWPSPLQTSPHLEG